jgi:catabolite regulation protein CreA
MSNMRDNRWTAAKWFEDPSSASIAVTQTGPLKFKSKIGAGASSRIS